MLHCIISQEMYSWLHLKRTLQLLSAAPPSPPVLLSVLFRHVNMTPPASKPELSESEKIRSTIQVLSSKGHSPSVSQNYMDQTSNFASEFNHLCDHRIFIIIWAVMFPAIL